MKNNTKMIIQSVADMKRNTASHEDNVKERTSTMIAPRIKKHLKSKYGTVANGILVLAMKDMNEI